MHLTHTLKINRKDGTEAEHMAEALEFIPRADGAVTIVAHCCGDPSTLSRHTFYDIAAMDEEAIKAEVMGHLERVASHHAAAEKSVEFIRGLVKG